MKDAGETLRTYLSREKNFTSCDLYMLKLRNGNTYYYTDADEDILWDGAVYRHNAVLLKRQQVKLNDRVVVDTMNVTIYAGKEDRIEGIPFMKAAHDGVLDRAEIHLSRCFFRNGAVLGVIGLFGGIAEIKKCGGLVLNFTVKAKTSGLSQEFPVRKFYPQGAYNSTSSSHVVEDGTNTDYCLIAPFIPLKEALL